MAFQRIDLKTLADLLSLTGTGDEVVDHEEQSCADHQFPHGFQATQGERMDLVIDFEDALLHNDLTGHRQHAQDKTNPAKWRVVASLLGVGRVRKSEDAHKEDEASHHCVQSRAGLLLEPQDAKPVGQGHSDCVHQASNEWVRS